MTKYWTTDEFLISRYNEVLFRHNKIHYIWWKNYHALNNQENNIVCLSRYKIVKSYPLSFFKYTWHKLAEIPVSFQLRYIYTHLRVSSLHSCILNLNAIVLLVDARFNGNIMLNLIEWNDNIGWWNWPVILLYFYINKSVVLDKEMKLSRQVMQQSKIIFG